MATSRIRRPRNPLAVIAIAVVIVVVAALIGGEFYARHKVKTCLSNQFRHQMGTSVDVGLGFKPVLIDMIDHKVPTLTLDSTGDRFGPAIGMKVHAKVHGIRLVNDGKRAGTIDSSTAAVFWSSDGITDTLKQRLADTVTDVKTNTSDGTVEIDGIFDVHLILKPQVENGIVEVKTQNAQFLGVDLPNGVVDSVIQLLSESLQQSYPIGMTVHSVRVTGSGVILDLRGGHYDLPEPAQGSQNYCTGG